MTFHERKNLNPRARLFAILRLKIKAAVEGIKRSNYTPTKALDGSNSVCKQLVRLSANEGIMYIFARCVASVSNVSVAFGSKERPTNGIFGVSPARKMGGEPKNESGGVGKGKEDHIIAAHA